MSAEENLTKAGLLLPPAPAPKGVYKPLIIEGKLAYLSGHGPILPDGNLMIGKVGEAFDIDQAKEAARQVGLAILSTLKSQLGNLDKIEKVVKVLGMVNAWPDFKKHPYVINGCSELFVEIWGPENGIGARSAVGMASLPDNIPVEIEAIFKLKDESL